MKRKIPHLLCWTLAMWLCAGWARDSDVAATSNATSPVTLTETDSIFTLDNGLLAARIQKRTGTLVSLQYKGQELLAQRSPGGALGGYWSSVGSARAGRRQQAVVRADPGSNGGLRAEIACNSLNEPSGPEAPLDVSLRYALGAGESWLYAYAVWSHKPGYSPFSVGEARYAVKLNPDVFDFLTIDQDRRRVMPTPEDWDRGLPLNLKEARRMTTGLHKGEAEHKYDYSALIYEIPAYGWSSTKRDVGLWFINPSFEYMAGGPTKVELTGHLDVNPGGMPTLLNMWLGSHYGGSSLAVAEDEDWAKVVGPFLIYCNSAESHGALWRDALARAAQEAKRWPYGWLQDAQYPPAAQRGGVSGQLVLHDPLVSNAKMSNVWIGVTAPDYAAPSVGRDGFGRFGTSRRSGGFVGTNSSLGASNPSFPDFAARLAARGGFPPEVDWQRDGKHYQFWTRADPTGRFLIPNVRPGNYTLHAIADGVLGEFARTNITVEAGQQLELGRMKWQPERFGRTVWEIGIPDRTAREFRHGNHYWQWGLYYAYPKEFPNDVDFVIGKSDWRTDWNYAQPPRIESADVPLVSEDDEPGGIGPLATSRAGRGTVRSTTWSIRFDLPDGPRGRAMLRLAFCGTHAGCRVEAFVNGASVGDTGPLPSTSTMQRDGIRAYWIEKRLGFDAARLRAGENIIGLLSHADSWNQGVLYDSVRLELGEENSTVAR